MLPILSSVLKTSLFIGLFGSFLLCQGFSLGGGGSGSPSLYDANKDDIDILNKTSFKSVVYGSDKASFVEFYAHWCGACQRYSQHWKEIAKDTKPWHSKVIRVAAINCGDSFNDELCREFNIEYYPTLRLFPAQASFDKPDHDSKLIKTDKNEGLIQQMISHVEQHSKKPEQWPDLEPFTSKRLDALFVTNRNAKFGFLVFEKDDCDVGKKLILDFSAQTDKLIIRRVSPSSNRGLIDKFGIDTRRLPMVYLIHNTENSLKQHEIFNEALLNKYTSVNTQVKGNIEDVDDDDDDYDDAKSDRYKYARFIRKFIKLNNLMSKDELNKMKDNANAGKALAEEIKKGEVKQHLNSDENKLHMQDLESGLNQMLRSEISHSKLIGGAKLKALKEWMRVLSKYFPGRKPVRNYLNNLYSRINSSQITEITGNQWKIFADENKSNAFLPDKTEWIHCKGSDFKFRGYPCSLWSLFHVLTVSQIETEKAKSHPFEESFDVKEVIEGIRTFVENFFSCRECSENFMKETSEYLRHLSKPHDAIKYLWIVHNKVNKRLADDSTTDPSHPKLQFPTKEQCPKCYLPSVKSVNDLADHESPWQLNEVLLFLTSFYSKYQIEPVLSGESQNRTDTTQKIIVKEFKPNPAQEPVVDMPLVDNFEIDNDNIVVDQPRLPKKANKRDAKMGLILEESLNENSAQKSSDIKLSLILIIFAISIFGLLFLYFGYLKRNVKLKKHII